jgi:hypothetical protein
MADTGRVRLVPLVLAAGCSYLPGAIAPPRDDADTADGSATVDGTMPPADAAIDAPPLACGTGGLTCAGTAVATTCNGACWVKCTQTVPVTNQLQASVNCIAWGGKLAPVRTAADQACVTQTLFPSQAHWIGFEQAGGATEVDQLWSWNSDAQDATPFGWGNGQPNDTDLAENGQENCAFINTAGEWHDESCANSGLYRFSCRRD